MKVFNKFFLHWQSYSAAVEEGKYFEREKIFFGGGKGKGEKYLEREI